MTTLKNLIRRKSFRIFILLLVALLPYVFYLLYILSIDRGPVDYETFMNIGSKMLNGQPVYSENSYYPMPYVMIFAFFSWLPRSLSMLLWFSLPVLAVLFISKWNPGVLLFAPVFSHFLGGQTSLPAAIGLWGYRLCQGPEDSWGGVWLSLCTLKPQLGIIPIAWAVVQWIRWSRENKRIPRQALSFMISVFLIYLPGFLIMPDWPLRWLQAPRPLFERALSGFLPRTLMQIFSPSTAAFWLILILFSGILFFWVWRLNGKKLNLDLIMVASFIASPLVHDYDLIQLIPVLENTKRLWSAVLFSLPGWFVILFAYQMDSAWYAFTIIAPGVLWYTLFRENKNRHHSPATAIAGS